ncbi:stage VI sporulation protein D [Fontibacillus panacisegetis]|uniref:Stage VI sporulation protein D n=1 Tax=Fontibacillus panacisegetis TaxID=670482 RepID=A0A1G7JNL4_9BACL|nr:LysM peptidoglycan-binding domain-containing protein [Fontibacillus panacisegetis]SDF26059.1 stage VI sporulation protein D [Fontibacillus panacisegetis]
MVDQSYGLRFDIYERIHLSEDVVGIEELEEIELFPRIQVIPGDDYAALRGHLLLSGLYLGEGETRELEHWIPVEITIPLSRVNKLEDIAVEIETFDVDLLSARSLNITGVLSLQGIETSSVAVDTEGWNDREYVVAHEPFQETANNPSSEWIRSEEVNELHEVSNTDEQEQPLSWNNSFASAQTPAIFEDNEEPEAVLESEVTSRDPEELPEEEQHVWFQNFEKRQNSPDEVSAEAVVQNEVETYDFQNGPDLGFPVSGEIGLDDGLEQAQVLDEQSEPSRPQLEEKKELKIALGSKKNTVDVPNDGFGITNLITGNRIGNEPNQSQLELLNKQDEESLAATGGGEAEDLQWKKLFIRSGEQEPFRKLKLVIVQQEETLEDIAQRYHLSSRELQLYNRLSEQQLAEGQVLYIP